MIRRVALWILVAIGVVALSAIPAAAAVPADGRAWELVTPSDPVGPFVRDVVGIDPGGDRIVYSSVGAMPGAPAGDLIANNLATRGADGWATTPLGFPYSNSSVQLPSGLVALSGDLLTSIWISTAPFPPGAPSSGNHLLLRREADGHFERLADMGESESMLVGSSEDAEVAVFSTEEHLRPSDAGRTEGRSIYRVAGSTLAQVDVRGSSSLLSPCGSTVSKQGGVSRSGERVFFTNPDPTTECGTPSRVYLREAGSFTVEASASRCSRPDCNAKQAVTFVGATPSGGSAFMVTNQQLTNDDHDAGADLYRFDTVSRALTLISAGSPEAGGEVTDSPVYTSEDGSRVYFHSQGRLLTGEGNESGENLYMADERGLHFVAPIGDTDPLQISADGRIALLQTDAALESGDLDERSDAYRYDAEAGTLERLSVGPGGGNGPFDAIITSPIKGLFSGSVIPSRALADGGRRLFFSTDEALVAEDVNEAADVYEWYAGKIGLVSSGVGENDAQFATVSPNGATVVFGTAASLLPRDRDGGDFDFYAARLGGGFAEDAGQSGCSGDACGAVPFERITRPTPISASDSKKEKTGRSRIRLLSGDAGHRIAETGQANLLVSVPAPGRVSARASAWIDGKRRTVASGNAGAARPGRLRLVLRATGVARQMLAQGNSLDARLVLRQAELRFVCHVVLGAGGG